MHEQTDVYALTYRHVYIRTHRMPQLPGVRMSTYNGDSMSFKDLEDAHAMDTDCIVCLLDSSSASNTGNAYSYCIQVHVLLPGALDVLIV